jgi:hypothetical protein
MRAQSFHTFGFHGPLQYRPQRQAVHSVRSGRYCAIPWGIAVGRWYIAGRNLLQCERDAGYRGAAVEQRDGTVQGGRQKPPLLRRRKRPRLRLRALGRVHEILWLKTHKDGDGLARPLGRKRWKDTHAGETRHEWLQSLDRHHALPSLTATNVVVSPDFTRINRVCLPSF